MPARPSRWIVPVIAGYFAFKWLLANEASAEKSLALGGMYHWTALIGLAVLAGFTLQQGTESAGSWWGDVRRIAKPLLLYSLLASLSVLAWNHGIAKETTDLRLALREAQIMEATANEASFEKWVGDAGLEKGTWVPDRETYREQALSQVRWMLSPSVMLVFSLLTYALASIVLAVVTSLLLHKIWNITSLG
ncbi:MAG: hypothetical protein O3B70_01860 [Bacteroidetes bacterium]|nr:hypothetical protein [Bacteroidota bacterium]MDA0903055.1 hypothetical protein [Bacteroidota bacterium]MDA1241735.1 hypothetical protein [Bacteroidota bacterium]